MDLCDEILELSTLVRQLQKWSEECLELHDAVFDGTSIDHIIEEIADVMNCIGQMCLVYDISHEEIEAKIFEKQKRTIKRLKEGYYDHQQYLDEIKEKADKLQMDNYESDWEKE